MPAEPHAPDGSIDLLTGAIGTDPGIRDDPTPERDGAAATASGAPPPAPAPAASEASPSRRARLLRLLTGQWGVALVALAAGTAAWWYTHRNGLALLHDDARAATTVARGLLDGSAGVAEPGAASLPLPHLLMSPFTLVTPWWRSGLAAAPVALTCLVVGALALFRVVLLAGRSCVGAWVAVLLLVTNPGWLHLHATALTDPVLSAALLVTVAGLAGWIRSDKPYSGGEIALFCGLPAAAGLLAGYAGWILVPAAAALVAAVAQLRWRRWRYTLRCVRSFVVLPAVAAAWWLWSNLVHRGDPLGFLPGRDPARPDPGDPVGSVADAVHSTLGGSGTALVVAGALGAALWLAVGRGRPRALPPWLLVVVPAGCVAAGLLTDRVSAVPGDPGGALVDPRVGLLFLPALAAMSGLGLAVLDGSAADRTGGRRPVVAAVLGLALVGAVGLSWGTDHRAVPVVADGLAQRDRADGAWAAAGYLHREAAAGRGLVLVDDSTHPVAPLIGVGLDRVTTPASGPRWDRALRDPTTATWVVADTAGAGDAVARAVAADPAFADDFEPVFSRGTVTVYRNRAPERPEGPR